jgi:hypothetical protein
VAFVNPELIDPSTETQTGDEGCLSFPGIFAPVKRAEEVRVKAFDVDGRPFEVQANALFARALQHETDHLNGRLLIDQVGPVKREIIKRKMRKEALETRRDGDDDGPETTAHDAGDGPPARLPRKKPAKPVPAARRAAGGGKTSA